jgi:hypothetical protein
MTFVVTVIVGIGVVVLWLLSVVLSEASTGKVTGPIGERCRLQLLDASAGIALPSIEVKS